MRVEKITRNVEMCISFGFKLFKKKNHLVISHYEGFVDDEEVLLLYDIKTSPNLDLRYDLYERFDFDVLDDDECLSEFRFRKHDLPLLAKSTLCQTHKYTPFATTLF